MSKMVILLVCFGLGAQAQTELHLQATPKPVKANQPVLLKVLDPPPGVHFTWKKETGEGGFDHGDGGTEVSFTPTKPGTTVKISCTPSGVPLPPAVIYLDVSDEGNPQSGGIHEDPPSPKTTPASVTPPPTPHQPEALPRGLVPITEIIAANDGLVIPAGKMGDAQSPTGPVSPIRPASSCKYVGECVLFEYDLARSSLGWAALAWQVVRQGDELNFGQAPGKDLSSREFRSLRVWARVQTGQPSLRVEFKSGGNVAPQYAVSNAASYVVSSGVIPVGQDWQSVCLDLPTQRRDALKNVVSPLTIVVSGVYNPAERIGLAINAPSFSNQSCPGTR